MKSTDIGIDLGTVKTIITVGGKGIVINEPSVVAYDKKKKQILSVGEEAYRMIGRTHENIIVVKPLADGVISGNVMAETMISGFIRKVSGNMMFKPRIIISVPSYITDAERRAVVEAALSAGARKVYIIQEPFAALLGAGVDISKPNGCMGVDIGGGTSDIAVVSLNGIVVSGSVRIAGNKIDEAIIRFVSQKYKLLIGDKTAETVKKTIANVSEPKGTETMRIKGRHLIKGLPAAIDISDLDVAEAVAEPVKEIIGEVMAVLEATPPELVGDIYENGIILTGGGALLGGLSKAITQETHIKFFVSDNPLECVARGISEAFRLSDELLDGFEKISLYKYK